MLLFFLSVRAGGKSDRGGPSAAQHRSDRRRSNFSRWFDIIRWARVALPASLMSYCEYKHAHTHIHAHTRCTLTHTHTRTYKHIQTRTHSYTNTHAHTHTPTHTHTYIHTYIHTHTLKHTHIHACTHIIYIYYTDMIPSRSNWNNSTVKGSLFNTLLA